MAKKTASPNSRIITQSASFFPDGVGGGAAPSMLPALVFLGVIAAFVVVFTLCFMAFYANDNVDGEAARLQSAWADRAAFEAPSPPEKIRRNIETDKDALGEISRSAHLLTVLLCCAAGAMLLFMAAGFALYRACYAAPLRKLEESCREFAANDLKPLLWGTDRADAIGNLARTIQTLRGAIIRLSDMVVEDAHGGTSHIRFEGRSADVFNNLMETLKASVAEMQEQGTQLGTITELSGSKLQHLSGALEDKVAGLESAIDASRMQLAGLQDEWTGRLHTAQEQHGQLLGNAKHLVDKFTHDMHTLNQVAVATGQRVATTLQTLTASDRDIKRAAQQSMEASSVFARQAADLTEKLMAATSLLKASGKVMSETTETTRTRLMEAVNSVESHDQALHAFLADTSDKTAQLAGLLDALSLTAHRATDTVNQFDGRMEQFDSRSMEAFGKIDASSKLMEGVAGQLGSVQEVMRGALDAMHGHTEGLARILITIRDEYASFMQDWRVSLDEATPVIAQLKDSSQQLKGQLNDEWNLYTRQSRQLLEALEHDVSGMNARTQKVSEDLERLIGNVTMQSQRVGDSAGHFDLQIANLSQRIENAASSVLRSNDGMLKMSGQQMQDMHNAVSDMVQRLGILTQLTGTLGAVAGQLGQIVPALSDGAALQRAGAPQAMSASSPNIAPLLLERFEAMNNAFGNTLGGIKSEFDTVREQIGAWVGMLTKGYNGLAQQIGMMDRALHEKITDAQHAQPFGEQLMPAMRLIHESLEKGYTLDQSLMQHLQSLQGQMHLMASDVQQTVRSLQKVGTMVDEGFARLATPPTSANPVDQLQLQISYIAKMLDQYAIETKVLAESPLISIDILSKQKPYQIAETVMTAISRLHEIAESIERMADHADAAELDLTKQKL